MKTRRGSSLWGDTDGLSSMITRFQPGDIVVPVAVQQEHFLGVVKEVLPKINKVMVLWNGGSLKQHDPDEIMLEPHQNEIVRTRMSSTRRGSATVVAKELMAISVSPRIKQRLEYLRKEIEAERISYGEIAELQSLAKYIDPSDTVLLEWAGVSENRRRGNATTQG